jgi:hypothetical protein
MKKIKPHKKWDFNPAPRVVNSKKQYKRNEKFKKSFVLDDDILID